MLEIITQNLNKDIQLFKASFEKVGSPVDFRVRNSGIKLKATAVSHIWDIKQYLLPETQIIIVDEAQFIKGELQDWINLSQHEQLVVAGLELTSEQEPFGIMPKLVESASKVIRLTSTCNFCGSPQAKYTDRLTPKENTIALEDNGYVALCESCFKEFNSNE